jgi:dienelactone hydrolase
MSAETHTPVDQNSKEALTAKMHQFAPFAKAAYSAESGNYTVMPGYHVDREFSNQNRILYASDTDPKKAIYTFRGTNIKNWNDIGTDVLNTVGLERYAARNQNAARYAKAAQNKYSDLSLTGHSLGGEQALYAAKSLKRPPTETVAMAPHVSWSSSMSDKLFRSVHNLFFGSKKRQPSTTTIFKTENDPVSIFANSHYRSSTIATVREVNPRNPHSMESFLP